MAKLNLHVLLATALLTLPPSYALAASNYAIAGVGAYSCGQFLRPKADSKGIHEAIVVSWFQGFLSGTNTQRSWGGDKSMKLQPDPESILTFIEKHCRDNPLDNLYQAAMKLERSI